MPYFRNNFFRCNAAEQPRHFYVTCFEIYLLLELKGIDFQIPWELGHMMITYDILGI